MSEVKSRLYTNITHEFRTPLTVILGMADKLKGNFSEKEMIKRNGEQLLNMVNQILDLSKVEAGGLSIKYIQSDIITYLKYLVESLISLAEKKNIRLVFNSEVKELTMDYDQEKIKRRTYNLISNALKFTNAGGTVIIMADIKEEKLELRFKDSGGGIPQEDLPQIFDRFFQASNQVYNGSGSGIGLALVKELVLLLGGDITVDSEVGVGTQFTVLLPITQKAERIKSPALKSKNKITPTIKDTELSSQYINNENIALIVEDNSDVASYIEKCIQEDYKIFKAKNGAEGLTMAQRNIPDIIISDVMMPIMDGYELCDLLKNDEKTSHIPIILLTAKATQEEKIQGFEKGADAYLIKPFSENELILRMSKLIALRKELQKRYTSTIETPERQEDKFIKRVINLLDKNIAQRDYKAQDLVSDLNLSRMQVLRKIKGTTGMTTVELINNYKLEKAHNLLHQPDVDIQNIAYEVGYSSASYFTKLYKAKYGHLPSEVNYSKEHNT